MTSRRFPLVSILLLAAALLAPKAFAEDSAPRPTPAAVLSQRYRLVLDLVRHTATYSPPVAARAFAYFGIIAYEATASCGSHMGMRKSGM